ncbi:hypothetical protein [Neisseria elongata]|uniref:hypothetical protein n=1 Tax=Neisseria elongata TaxID=495 RepID=UPI000D38CF41|nr:hypothetical protein [Neisseria elongata]
MNEENSSENQPVKKKSFLSIGKLFWFFIFLLAVAVAALLINVWLELQRPPPQSQPVQQQNTVEVWSPNGTSAVAPANNGNPLVPQTLKNEPASKPDAPDDTAVEAVTPPANNKPKAKDNKVKDDQIKQEKLSPNQEKPLEPINRSSNSSEIPLEPINKRPKNSESAVEPVNKPAPKADKPTPKRQTTDMDNLF